MKMKKRSFNSIHPRLALLLVAGVMAFSALGAVPLVRANLSRQIEKLQQENKKNEAVQYKLEIQATDFSDQINKLQQQMAALENQIQTNRARSNALEKEITKAEAELDKQKQLLGQSIKAMYLEGQITTIEMLASSRNLSEFVDKQQYRDAVKDKIKLTLDKITRLKLQLNGQKEEVENLIKEQRAAQEKLDEQRAEQNRLLGLNVQERADLDVKIQKNAERITELQAQQVLANARLFGGKLPPGVPGGGGYPWGDAVCVHPGAADPPCGQYDWGYPEAGIYDKWGYGYRNCTSYVAWKIKQRTGRMISGLGDAKSWPTTVGDRVDVDYGQGARVGDAAVITAGTYGHVMYVEAVEGDTAYVSDYNVGGDGYYRAARPIKQAGLYFIHF